MHQERRKKDLIKELNKILKIIIDDPQIIVTVLDVNLPTKKGVMIINLSVFPDHQVKNILQFLKKEIDKIKKFLKRSKIKIIIPKRIFFKYSPNLKFMAELDKILK